MFDLSELKKFFLYNLIGALIISALVAIVNVLIGEFNELSAKILFTLLMVVIHSLISLGFIWKNSKTDMHSELSFFSNILFLIIVLSFMTSILGIWNILEASSVFNAYMSYLVFGSASLLANLTFKAHGKKKYIDYLVISNIILITLLALLLQPVIFFFEQISSISFYFRLIAAISITVGTLSILIIIFYKIYLNKHPEEKTQSNFSFLKFLGVLFSAYILFNILLYLFFIFL